MRRANRLFGNKSRKGPCSYRLPIDKKLRGNDTHGWKMQKKKAVWRESKMNSDPCESLFRSDPTPTAPDNLLVDYKIA